VRRRDRTTLAFASLLCLTIGACIPFPATRGNPDGLSWPATLASAQQAAAGGRYRDADSVLAAYASRHAASPEARETEYWRALFKLDPTNRDGSLEAALAWLDRYIAAGASAPHYDEAVTLRRLAGQISTLSRLASASTTTQTSTPRPVVIEDKAKEEEVQRLRAELAKANEELERIKKRLTAPKP